MTTLQKLLPSLIHLFIYAVRFTAIILMIIKGFNFHLYSIAPKHLIIPVHQDKGYSDQAAILIPESLNLLWNQNVYISK